jgi:hypothetical protein
MFGLEIDNRKNYEYTKISCGKWVISIAVLTFLLAIVFPASAA